MPYGGVRISTMCVGANCVRPFPKVSTRISVRGRLGAASAVILSEAETRRASVHARISRRDAVQFYNNLKTVVMLEISPLSEAFSLKDKESPHVT